MVTGYITPGLSRVFWVTTIAAPAAPTVAEVNAGQELTGIARGMPDAPRSGNPADDSDLSSRVDKQQRGTISLGAITLTVKRTKATETAYNAVDEGDVGFLLVFRKGTAGASPAAADVCDVYTGEIDIKAPGTPGRNDVDFSTLQIINTDEPRYNIAVVSGS